MILTATLRHNTVRSRGQLASAVGLRTIVFSPHYKGVTLASITRQGRRTQLVRIPLKSDPRHERHTPS